MFRACQEAGKQRDSLEIVPESLFSMWLIPRDTNGRSSDRIPLPQQLRAALTRWYSGDGSQRDQQAGVTLMKNARIGDKWIACGCLGADTNPPILTPALLSEAETYYLRRLTGAKRPEHRPDCPFFRDQVTHKTITINSPATPVERPSGFFEVLRPAPDRLSQRPEEESEGDRIRNKPTPRLARLLWRLMDNAGSNSVAPLSIVTDHSIASEFASIGRITTKMEIAPGIELARAFWTHPRPLQSNMVYATLRRLAADWPKTHAPQGFVLLYAPSIDGNEVHVPNSDPVEVRTPIQGPSIHGKRVKGPFLVIIVAGDTPERRGYAPLRAYAQPIYSGRMFVPVDSDYERSVMRAILDCQRHLHSRDVDMAIQKPLFDSMTPDGPCRPDFMIEARSNQTGEIRTIVVEAMGFDTEEYEAAKAVTHPRMKHLGDLVTLNSIEIDNGTAVSKLLRILDI